ncbi:MULTISPECIES: hypothetical protein [unclassified Mesorhizobium]|uniref:hypothetical protein n=1 Tax=unclassified Mesorhizobium TaxID=325217 RepID=UPI00096975D9|nr:MULTISPECIES: hypothetical protein [unclassified Mesorhizobium]MBN9253205.1 hypothetical protein [Mesorhizobium sp.]OJX82324.1 MAG: hypothetical protein BGO93_24330 [Mesorhizobium sp. 65-26]
MTIPHAEALGRARTAADYAAVIVLLDADLSQAAASRGNLLAAEDRAILGDGDLAAARAGVDDCNERIALLERTVALAREHRAAAAADEARADIEALGAATVERAEAFGTRWREARRLVELLRQELFEADALSRAIATANSLFESAGLVQTKVNLSATRRAATAGQRAAAPARLSRAGQAADRLLLSLLDPGRARDPRPKRRARAASTTIPSSPTSKISRNERG